MGRVGRAGGLEQVWLGPDGVTSGRLPLLQTVERAGLLDGLKITALKLASTTAREHRMARKIPQVAPRSMATSAFSMTSTRCSLVLKKVRKG